MRFRCGLLSFYLLAITLLRGTADGLSRAQQQPAQHVDRPVVRSELALRRPPAGTKAGEELPAKRPRLDHLLKMENDVIEPKRKRSFPGNNAPLDRLSISSMETKQASKKQSKGVGSPRRRVSPPLLDRIGMNRMPSSRG